MQPIFSPPLFPDSGTNQASGKKLKSHLRTAPLPPDLQKSVESAFDQAFKNSITDVRRALLSAVQNVVEQQVSLALASYSDQVASCEGAVLIARKNIIEESTSMYEQSAKLKSLWSQNSRDSSRLQDGLSKLALERSQLQEQRSALERERKKVDADRARLCVDGGKVQASLSELRSQKQQILQWQHMLMQMETGMTSKSDNMQSNVVVLTVPPAAKSLEEAQRFVQQTLPKLDQFEDISIPVVQLPTPPPIQLTNRSKEATTRRMGSARSVGDLIETGRSSKGSKGTSRQLHSQSPRRSARTSASQSPRRSARISPTASPWCSPRSPRQARVLVPSLS